MLEYCWTKRRCHEEDEPPAAGWQYYGGCIKGSIEDPANLWTVTRWAKQEGDTQRFTISVGLCKGKERAMALLKPEKIFSVPKKVGTIFASVTSHVTVTPNVTPSAPVIKPKGVAWALQLLRT